MYACAYYNEGLMHLKSNFKLKRFLIAILAMAMAVMLAFATACSDKTTDDDDEDEPFRNMILRPAHKFSKAELEEIFSTFANAEATVETDLDKGTLKISGSGKSKEYSFKIGGFDLALVQAGGWVAYADQKY